MDTKTYEARVEQLRDAIACADAIVVGAGAGLSTAAGLEYAGERFRRRFGDFIERYGFRDMYSAGFFPFPTPEEKWAFWSRHIWTNRYEPAPKDTYEKLLALLDPSGAHDASEPRDPSGVHDPSESRSANEPRDPSGGHGARGVADFFVITTNVDHRFQLAGFPKERLFYTQGDYGLWQCAKPCHAKTYDNFEAVSAMMERQENMRVPSDLVPACPVCGGPMEMNLRADGTFVEDEGWHAAAARYRDFLEAHRTGRVLYLELGVGGNTPVIIKYPFWRMVHANPEATYACLNLGDAYAPSEIEERSILLDADIDQVLTDLAAK